MSDPEYDVAWFGAPITPEHLTAVVRLPDTYWINDRPDGAIGYEVELTPEDGDPHRP